MLGDSDHVQLLSAARDLAVPVMISTRQNDLYDDMLHDWRKESFQTSDRGGAVLEIIYMNYPVPEYLHEYTYIGDGRTKRQEISRKAERFSAKLQSLTAYERHIFIQTIIEEHAPAVKHFSTTLLGKQGDELM